MKKLLDGIVEFRKKVLPGYRERFGRLALGQSPDVLFIACSDSRVVPNTFASTDPGDLFVVRNVGNMIPCCGDHGLSVADESEAAAIEFAVDSLKVEDIIVCGHSDCGAMHAILTGREKVKAPHLRSWLRHGEAALEKLPEFTRKGASPFSLVNQLSQLNVLQQLEHLRSYPDVDARIRGGKLRLHAWWFELGHADVYAYEESMGRFILIDEEEAARISKRLKRPKARAKAARAMVK